MAKLKGTSGWPVERDIMARPERLKYVRKMEPPKKGCVFCMAAKKGVRPESLVLYRGRRAMVIMNKYPYNNGHLLILPLRHCGELGKLRENEYRDVTELTRISVKILEKVIKPAGFNIGLNLGSAAGAGLPEHLHYHVIPRWRGDTNFFPLVAETKVVVETLEQTFGRLLPYFKAIDL
jgi:ATP adenylyltransferase